MLWTLRYIDTPMAKAHGILSSSSCSGYTWGELWAVLKAATYSMLACPRSAVGKAHPSSGVNDSTPAIASDREATRLSASSKEKKALKTYKFNATHPTVETHGLSG